MAEPPDPRLVTPYQALIREQRLAKDMSVSELARRARMPRSTIHKIENQPPKERPEDATIDKLAGALGISRERILDAVSESLGLRVAYGRPTLATQQLLDRVRHLPAEQAARWHRLARALADALASEDERVMHEQNLGGSDGQAESLTVNTDRIPVANDEVIVQADVGELSPQSDAEREYVDTISDAALDRLRRRMLG